MLPACLVGETAGRSLLEGKVSMCPMCADLDQDGTEVSPGPLAGTTERVLFPCLGGAQ